MYKCKGCWMLKISEKQGCNCNAKPFNDKKLVTKKPIAQVSEKKKQRLEDNGTEIQLFKTRFQQLKKQGKNICMITGVTLYMDEDSQEESLTPASFPHILPKGKYPEYRYFLNNIWLVKWIEEHQIFDEIVNRIKDDVWLALLVERIKQGKEIDFTGYINIF